MGRRKKGDSEKKKVRFSSEDGKDNKVRYILIGVVIGIVIGVALFYVLMTTGVLRPFLFSDMGRILGNREWAPDGHIPSGDYPTGNFSMRSG